MSDRMQSPQRRCKSAMGRSDRVGIYHQTDDEQTAV